jgi:hypothetical protein
MDPEPAPCEGDSYRDEDPIPNRLLRAGEGNFSIDPLSSQGVRSAMGSTAQRALVQRTMLARPESSRAAAAFYDARLAPETRIVDRSAIRKAIGLEVMTLPRSA